MKYLKLSQSIEWGLFILAAQLTRKNFPRWRVQFFNYISFYVWFMHAYQIMSKKKYNLKFFFQISINKTHGLYKHIANWKFPWLENNLVDNSLQWYHRQFRFDRNGPNNFWSSFYINYIRQLQKWYMYCNNWCKCIIIVLIKVPCPDNIPCPYYKS